MARPLSKSSGNRPAPRQDRRHAQDRLRGLFDDLVADGSHTGINPFCRHVGISMPVEGTDPGSRWWPTFLAHYLDQDGTVNEERVAADLTSFPPIAARVAELRERH